MILLSFFVFLFGAIFGSFLSVVIFRLPEDESIVKGRSYCPQCQRALTPIELMPILSFCLQRGRCRHCHAKIGFIYPLLEIINGLLFVLAFSITLGTGQTDPIYLAVTFAYFASLFTILHALFYIDLFYQLLLDILVFPALLLTILYHGFLFIYFGLMHHAQIIWPAMTVHLLPNPTLLMTATHLQNFDPILLGYGFGIATALFFVILLLATKGKGMGGGDIKYALVLGAVCGWPNAIIAIFAAFLSGAIISLILLGLRKKKIGNVIPFGPFLILGTLIGLCFGTQLVDLYLTGVLV